MTSVLTIICESSHECITSHIRLFQCSFNPLMPGGNKKVKKVIFVTTSYYRVKYVNYL